MAQSHVQPWKRLLLVWILAGTCLWWSACDPPPPATEVYTYLEEPSPGGTGKVYMGREIAQVTDHDPGALWLERPEREATEFPQRVVQALDLQPTDVVADIGAGTGYFTFRLSQHVPEGKVLAVDIQQEMLDRIQARMMADSVDNVELILGTVEDPNLPPASIDEAVIVVSYHEFSHPHEMMTHIVAALKPGGRLVLVEYRGEDATLQVDALHKMTEAQARREMEAVGLVWAETKDVLPQQHFMVFEKPVP